MSKFIYLLNAMEDAAQASDPSTRGYGMKRQAVLDYVADLEGRVPEALPKDDVPLKCEVIDGAIQFIVGEKVLAHATNICPRFYDAEQDRGMYHVTDQVAFAKDVARELNREREDGSTRLSDMMDDAIAEAISHGAEGVEETPSPQRLPTEE